MLGTLNLGGSNSSGSLFPIYQQLTEPSKKEGVWIKNNEKLKNIFIANNNENGDKECIRLENFVYNYASSKYFYAYENFIYYVGSGNGAGKIIKYDVLNGKSTVVVPSNSPYSPILIYNNELYYFKTISATNNKKNFAICKINILTQETTELQTFTENVNEVPHIALLKDETVYFIYERILTSTRTYRLRTYNILTGETTGMDISVSSTPWSRCLTGDCIYFIAGDKLYKYDTIRHTFTNETPTPSVSAYTSLASVGDNIYLFYGNTSDTEAPCYKYDLINNTYTLVCNIPNALKSHASVTVGNSIYIFCTDFNLYKFKSNIDINNGIYMFLNLSKNEDVGGYLLKELHKTIKKIWLVKNNEKIEKETYIGDGTSWNLLNGGN